MKKIFSLSLLRGVSGYCFADAIQITLITQFTLPVANPPVVSVGGLEFKPGKSKIVLKLAGKTCPFNSSGNPWGAGAGKGCTYAITVNNSTNTLPLPASSIQWQRMHSS